MVQTDRKEILKESSKQVVKVTPKKVEGVLGTFYFIYYCVMIGVEWEGRIFTCAGQEVPKKRHSLPDAIVHPKFFYFITWKIDFRKMSFLSVKQWNRQWDNFILRIFSEIALLKIVKLALSLKNCLRTKIQSAKCTHYTLSFKQSSQWKAQIYWK